MPTTSSPIEERLLRLEARIQTACDKAGRARSSVLLVAVSKRQPLGRIEALAAAGHRFFGENLVQAWQERLATVNNADALAWHLIGPLQSNKAKAVANGRPAMVHTVDRLKIARALDQAWNATAPLSVLIQVNIDREPQKAGCTPEELPELAAQIRDLSNLKLCGLMCIPRPPGEGAPMEAFKRLRHLSEAQTFETASPQLSMGMSQDFEAAIAEGATIIRVGTELFGQRAY